MFAQHRKILSLLLIVALSLTTAGCQLCGFATDTPLGAALAAGPFSVESLFGLPLVCLDPVTFLYAVLAGAVVPEPSGGYTPGGAFLREEAEREGAATGHTLLTIDANGVSGGARSFDSGFQSYETLVEPLADAAGRLVDPAAPATPPRVFFSETNRNSVAVVDPVSGQVVQRISVGSEPHGMAFSPDGATLYVANTRSGSISVVDVATLTATETIALPGVAAPISLAITPDGAKLYAVNALDAGTVVAIDTATNTPGEPIRVSRQPRRIRISPDGSMALIANFEAGTISILDTQTDAVFAALNSDRPHDMVFSPDGSRVWVVSARTIGRVFEYSIETLRETRQWQVGDTPTSLALTPDGTILVVTNSNSDFVSLIDVRLDEVFAEIPAPGNLGSVAVTISPPPALSSN